MAESVISTSELSTLLKQSKLRSLIHSYTRDLQGDELIWDSLNRQLYYYKFDAYIAISIKAL
jgi:hypothetical protein